MPAAGSTGSPIPAASSPDQYDPRPPTREIDAYDAAINGGLPTSGNNQTTE